MPRASTSAPPVDEIVDLAAAALRAGYHIDSLRRLLRSPDRPPFAKNERGKWVASASEFDDWLARRQTAAATS